MNDTGTRTDDSHWWRTARTHVRCSVPDIVTARFYDMFIDVGLTSNETVLNLSFEGVLPAAAAAEDVRRIVKNLGYVQCFIGSDASSSGTRESTQSLHMTDDKRSLITLSFSPSGWSDVEITTIDAARLGDFEKSLGGYLKTRSTGHEVHVLARGSDGRIQASSLGKHGKPLERGNYSPAVLEAFDHVVSDLGRVDPCGRLVLLEGPPGTGKTHLIRGMIDCVEKGTFVLIPPSIVANLGGPDLIDALISCRDESEGPIVLLLEDADEALAQRKFDNIAAVNAMLSLGDGIMGAALDVRIIASTNQQKTEIDSAVLRPGRLCRRMPVGALSPEQAIAIIERLGGRRPASAPNRMTLAEAYAQARLK